jgi:hypothetical protein
VVGRLLRDCIELFPRKEFYSDTEPALFNEETECLSINQENVILQRVKIKKIF